LLELRLFLTFIMCDCTQYYATTQTVSNNFDGIK